ncbi:MAG: ParB/RepB/Spo0J family partition protein [Taibaiella sp.]|nr:ParB/RepB/Spo0J family partition protein [Taibaiella sp.]
MAKSKSAATGKVGAEKKHKVPVPNMEGVKRGKGSVPPVVDMRGVVQEIEIGRISKDASQPRSFVTKEGIEELTESVRVHGVISAILVRPRGDGYVIVFGERRWRAAAAAGLKTVPCVVREMTDEEALEIQITENLQRENPHPMDEALAYWRMMKANVPFADICLKVGKDAKYVSVRLVLANLHGLLREVFYEGKCSMKDAVELARLGHSMQQEICSQYVPADWRTREGWRLMNMQWVAERAQASLANVRWDLGDADLLPEVGSCNACQSNSANTLALFTDGDPMCSMPACYKLKSDRAFARGVQEMVTREDVVFVGRVSRDKADEANARVVNEAGARVVDVQQVRVAKMPVTLAWDAWKEENVYEEKPDYNSYLEHRKREYKDWEKDRKGFEKEVKEEFAEMERAYDAELLAARNEYDTYCKDQEAKRKEIEEAYEAGKVRTGYMVTGSERGEMVPVIVDADVEMPGTDKSKEEEIQELLAREARNRELDGEKVWNKVRELISDNGYQVLMHTGMVEGVEMKALYVAMFESLRYEKQRYYMEHVLGGERDHVRLIGRFGNLGHDERNLLFRLLLVDKLYPANGRADNSLPRAYGMKVGLLYKEAEIKAEMAAINEKANARRVKVDERVSVLRRKR